MHISFQRSVYVCCLFWVPGCKLQILVCNLPLHLAHSCFLYVKEDCKQNQILISRGRYFEFWWNGMTVFLFMTKERSMGLEGLVGTNCQIIRVGFSLKTTQPSLFSWPEIHNLWSILRLESKCTIGAQKEGLGSTHRLQTLRDPYSWWFFQSFSC